MALVSHHVEFLLEEGQVKICNGFHSSYQRQEAPQWHIYLFDLRRTILEILDRLLHNMPDNRTQAVSHILSDSCKNLLEL